MLQDLAGIQRLLAQPLFAHAPLALDTQEEIEMYRREALAGQITE
jgi:hypothetical protein